MCRLYGAIHVDLENIALAIKASLTATEIEIEITLLGLRVTEKNTNRTHDLSSGIYVRTRADYAVKNSKLISGAKKTHEPSSMKTQLARRN